MYFLFALVLFPVVIIVFIMIYGLLCFTITNQKSKMILLIIGSEYSEKHQKGKKRKEDIKQELMKPIEESDDEYDPNLDEIGEGIKNLEDSITIIKRYEEIITAQDKKVNY